MLNKKTQKKIMQRHMDLLGEKKGRKKKTDNV